MRELASSRSLRSGPQLPLPEAVERVLRSQAFERAPTLRVLLEYLWRNRERPIGEYAIATEALGRSASFDAKIDATVRVQISRLRQRLEKYYAEEGRESPERLLIPVGSHQIEIETVEPQPAAVERPRDYTRPLVAACLVLLVACASLAILLVRARRAGTPSEAPRFWRAFHSNGRPIRIVLPTPVFFSTGGLMIRDVGINEYAEGLAVPRLSRLWKGERKPSLATNYTVTSDTYASVSLVRYLDRFAFPTRVASMAEAPLEALDSENLVALGTGGTLTPLKSYLDQMTLRMAQGEVRAEVINPKPGEPAQVNRVTEGPARSICPGVVGVMPGRSGRAKLMVVIGAHTSALVYTMISTNGLDQIERLWKAKGSPEFFEMIINSEMEGDRMVRSWPVVLRPFKAN